VWREQPFEVAQREPRNLLAIHHWLSATPVVDRDALVEAAAIRPASNPITGPLDFNVFRRLHVLVRVARIEVIENQVAARPEGSRHVADDRFLL